MYTIMLRRRTRLSIRRCPSPPRVNGGSFAIPPREISGRDVLPPRADPGAGNSPPASVPEGSTVPTGGKPREAEEPVASPAVGRIPPDRIRFRRSAPRHSSAPLSAVIGRKEQSTQWRAWCLCFQRDGCGRGGGRSGADGGGKDSCPRLVNPHERFFHIEVVGSRGAGRRR